MEAAASPPLSSSSSSDASSIGMGLSTTQSLSAPYESARVSAGLHLYKVDVKMVRPDILYSKFTVHEKCGNCKVYITNPALLTFSLSNIYPYWLCQCLLKLPQGLANS